MTRTNSTEVGVGRGERQAEVERALKTFLFRCSTELDDLLEK